GLERVETGADPVERPKQRELEPVLAAVGPDDAIEKLLRGRIDPALLVDGAEDQPRPVFVERGGVAHSVDLGGRGKDEPLAVLYAIPHDPEIFLEVELEASQGIARVFDGGRDRDERHDDVAFLDVVFDPLTMDGD